MPNVNVDVVKKTIFAGMDVEYQYNFAVNKEQVLEYMVKIKEALDSLFPVSDKEWTDILKEMGPYTERFILPKDENVPKCKNEYVVRGCVETTEYHKRKGKIIIENMVVNVPDEEAEFFGVYEVQDEDGTEHWIADFNWYDDAIMFALEKEKEEEK